MRLLADAVAGSVDEQVAVPGGREDLAPHGVDGRYGARIEDIAVCTEDGLEVLNNTPRELVVLQG